METRIDYELCPSSDFEAWFRDINLVQALITQLTIKQAMQIAFDAGMAHGREEENLSR